MVHDIGSLQVKVLECMKVFVKVGGKARAKIGSSVLDTKTQRDMQIMEIWHLLLVGDCSSVGVEKVTVSGSF